MNYQLVRTTTEDNVFLSGLFSEKSKDKPVLLSIHGFEGDFFSHKFINSIGEKLADNDISFLTVQTRGTFQKQEVITTEFESVYVGSHLELLEEAYLDIDGWVKFLNEQGYENIILAGHSLGTYKIVRYLAEGKIKDKVKKLILLCPFDKFGMLNNFTEGKYLEYVQNAKMKIEEGKGREYVPNGYEEVEMSYQTYHSWYEDNDFNSIFDFYKKDYTSRVLNDIEIPVHTIVGTLDEFFHTTNFDHPEEAIAILDKNIKHHSSLLVKDAQHTFVGYEDLVAEEFLQFIQK